MSFLNFFLFFSLLSSDSSDSQGYRFLLCNKGEIICQLEIFVTSIFFPFLINPSPLNPKFKLGIFLVLSNSKKKEKEKKEASLNNENSKKYLTINI